MREPLFCHLTAVRLVCPPSRPGLVGNNRGSIHPGHSPSAAQLASRLGSFLSRPDGRGPRTWWHPPTTTQDPERGLINAVRGTCVTGGLHGCVRSPRKQTTLNEVSAASGMTRGGVRSRTPLARVHWMTFPVGSPSFPASFPLAFTPLPKTTPPTNWQWVLISGTWAETDGKN